MRKICVKAGREEQTLKYNTSITKMVLNRRPIGQIRKGRPRKKWYDSVTGQIRQIGITISLI